MKRPTKIIVIATFILGVIGGTFAYAKHKYRDPAAFANHAVEHISEKLALDNTQEQYLITLKDTLLKSRQQLLEENQPFPQEVLDLVSAETFDQGKALTIITDRTTFINQSAPDIIVALGTFVDSLNNEQKAKVQSLIERKIEHKKYRDSSYH